MEKIMLKVIGRYNEKIAYDIFLEVKALSKINYILFSKTV